MLLAGFSTWPLPQPIVASTSLQQFDDSFSQRDGEPQCSSHHFGK